MAKNKAERYAKRVAKDIADEIVRRIVESVAGALLTRNMSPNRAFDMVKEQERTILRDATEQILSEAVRRRPPQISAAEFWPAVQEEMMREMWKRHVGGDIDRAIGLKMTPRPN